MPLAGLVVNRVHRTGAAARCRRSGAGGAERLDERGEHALTAGLLRVHAERAQRVAAEQHLRGPVRRGAPGGAGVEAPAQATDVHDLAGLRDDRRRAGRRLAERAASTARQARGQAPRLG